MISIKPVRLRIIKLRHINRMILKLSLNPSKLQRYYRTKRSYTFRFRNTKTSREQREVRREAVRVQASDFYKSTINKYKTALVLFRLQKPENLIRLK